MQSNVVKAFRQRLVRAGFTDIRIWDNFNGSYDVRCYSPDNILINKRLTEVQMNCIPRVVWFD